MTANTSYGKGLTVPATFNETVGDVERALADQGFGILTRIDVAATLREKLGVDHDPYVILGACNPPLAHRALEREPSVGLLLPCNVVVRSIDPHTTRVEILDPMVIADLAGDPELRAVAEEARARLDKVLDALSHR
ncbi:protein of unknown function DUF302 [Acidothermus cellulolyticus 11B]|uniref:DUF302 domain-containing protein n=1 Tax=Acidothermus cellulolyticus (strain ATCC 43068 / DSM 8971 / 11B) TaxID=351607 RepID=A0LSA3_ACIC1|nr:DUF302 domain-containing protein [Acidothermus cellulolyticus]ABK52313.1 protein of unknown function DUF302 [Acidothermus cellulolyticus 11B]